MLSLVEAVEVEPQWTKAAAVAQVGTVLQLLAKTPVVALLLSHH
jgi:hypothetical protein